MLKAKINNWMSQFDQWLWHAESTGTNKVNKTLWHCTRVLFAVVRDVVNGHITLHAMGLVYTTLLSIVPLLALSFLVLKGLGMHDKLKPVLEQYLAPLGDSAPEIVESTLGYVENIKVGVLGSVGLGLLLYWVISLVQKVERSFNEIWRVSTARSFSQRFSSYLSVIMVGPMLMVAATGATTTFISSDIVQRIIAVEPFGWLFATLSQLAPFLIMIGLFTFLYSFIPNTKVKIKHAFFGGLVAGLVWQTAIILFTLTVANSTNYQGIYRSFFGPIILLIWLYFSWLILLAGAAVAFYAQHSQQITRSRINVPSAEIDELTGLAILYEAGKQFYSNGHVTIRELESNMSVGPEVIQRILKRLQDNNILVVAEGGSTLVPGCPLEELHLSKVMQILRAPQQPLPMSITRYNTVVGARKKILQAIDHVFKEQTVSEWIHTGISENDNTPLALIDSETSATST